MTSAKERKRKRLISLLKSKYVKSIYYAFMFYLSFILLGRFQIIKEPLIVFINIANFILLFSSLIYAIFKLVKLSSDLYWNDEVDVDELIKEFKQEEIDKQKAALNKDFNNKIKK